MPASDSSGLHVKLVSHLCRARYTKFETKFDYGSSLAYMACTYCAELVCIHVQAGVSSVLG